MVLYCVILSMAIIYYYIFRWTIALDYNSAQVGNDWITLVSHRQHECLTTSWLFFQNNVTVNRNCWIVSQNSERVCFSVLMIHAETQTLMTVLLMVWVFQNGCCFQSVSEDAGDAVGGWNFGLLVIMTKKRQKRFSNMTLLNPLQLSSLSVFFHLIHITSFLSPGTAPTQSRQTSSANKVKITSGNIPPNATHLKDRKL